MSENVTDPHSAAAATDPVAIVESHLRRAERRARSADSNEAPRRFARQHAATYSLCLRVATAHAAQESRKRLLGLEGFHDLSEQSRALREMSRTAQSLVLQALLDLHLEILHAHSTQTGSTASLMTYVDRAHELSLGNAGRWLPQWRTAHDLVACRNEILLHGSAATNSSRRECAIRALLNAEAAQAARVQVIEHLAYLAGVALASPGTPSHLAD